MQRSDYVEGELTVGERSVELYFAPFSDEESGGVLIVLHDVTEHRKTEERRKELCKQVSKEGESSKVAIRNIRRDAMEAFKKKQKASEITEDDLKVAEKDLQKLTDDMCKEVDALLEKKEKELMAV